LIRVIDIETTGIDPATDAIIEIASVDMVREGGITNAMDALVRRGGPIPPGASAVHYIVDEDVPNALALAEVIDRRLLRLRPIAAVAQQRNLRRESRSARTADHCSIHAPRPRRAPGHSIWR
jgi:DNA polymerase III epsilon subunit-like protein